MMCTRYGPCAPMTICCSMSPVREGPEMKVTARPGWTGIAPLEEAAILSPPPRRTRAAACWRTCRQPPSSRAGSRLPLHRAIAAEGIDHVLLRHTEQLVVELA